MGSRMIVSPDGKETYINDDISVGHDNKPVFTGHIEADPIKSKGESAKMECRICHRMVEHLVGDDTNDGGIRGCEVCWKPPSHPATEGGVQNGQQKPTFD